MSSSCGCVLGSKSSRAQCWQMLTLDYRFVPLDLNTQDRHHLTGGRATVTKVLSVLGYRVQLSYKESYQQTLLEALSSSQNGRCMEALPSKPTQIETRYSSTAASHKSMHVCAGESNIDFQYFSSFPAAATSRLKMNSLQVYALSPSMVEHIL